MQNPSFTSPIIGALIDLHVLIWTTTTVGDPRSLVSFNFTILFRSLAIIWNEIENFAFAQRRCLIMNLNNDRPRRWRRDWHDDQSSQKARDKKCIRTNQHPPRKDFAVFKRSAGKECTECRRRVKCPSERPRVRTDAALEKRSDMYLWRPDPLTPNWKKICTHSSHSAAVRARYWKSALRCTSGIPSSSWLAHSHAVPSDLYFIIINMNSTEWIVLQRDLLLANDFPKSAYAACSKNAFFSHWMEIWHSPVQICPLLGIRVQGLSWSICPDTDIHTHTHTHTLA